MPQKPPISHKKNDTFTASFGVFFDKFMELKTKQRIAISAFFFLSGLCFSSWASRIPTIKTSLDINDAELGSLLFVMPISQLFGLPVSGWLGSKFNTRWPLAIGMGIHAISLYVIGLSQSIVMMVGSMFVFAFFMRILNIAMNAQALTLQKTYDKRINGSFHGLWSFGGIAGVGLSTLIISFDVNIQMHLFIVATATLITTGVAFNFLIVDDLSPSGNKLTLSKPDKQILLLGILVLFAAICEGGMFDWSGVYFKEVIKVDVFTAGYLIFMTCMALSRFISDYIINIIGMKSMYLFSALLMAFGMSMAVIFPTFWPAMIGFSLVGIGTSSIFPMTFYLAGTSKKYSPSMALSIVVTYAMIGVLFGPVLIGYIAHAVHLRASFIFLTLAGLTIIPVSRIYFRKYGNER